jgi:hypothetical protein
MATTRAVLRDADTMVRRLCQRRRTASGVTTAVLERAQHQLQQMRPLVVRVVAQARERLIGGDTHVPNKVLSLFEPHTTTIRKGTIAKPNEFGNLVTVQEPVWSNDGMDFDVVAITAPTAWPDGSVSGSSRTI